MTPLELYVDGKPLTLGKQIGLGGEGQIYALQDHQPLAVKVYFNPDAEREAKVAAMIQSELWKASDLVAFPMAIARKRNGAFAGFAMRLVKNHTSLHELYAPGARKIHFPKADFRFTVRSAANIARAVAKVHELGSVIGDINHSGILISDQAVAALIDADSFQFGARHLCRVGVPEYTPPELQGQRLGGILRTPNHDAFGLAVVIFQLLFMGRHPFMGKYAKGEMPIEKAIVEYRFAYSRNGDRGMTPPPGACQLSDFPDYIGRAFEAAFAPGAPTRPTAAQWITLLCDLEAALTRCSVNTMHYFPSAASRCTWCKMEELVGILLFLPAYEIGAGPNVADPGAAGFNLAAIWAAIEAVRIPSLESISPNTPAVSLEPSKEAKEFKGEERGKRVFGFLALAAAVGVLVSVPALWIVYVPLGWFGLVRTFGTSASNTSKFSARYQQAETAWQTTLDGWRKRIGLTEMHDLRRELQVAKNLLEGLPEEERRRIAEHELNRRDTQLHNFLETFPIRRATIRGIGPAKVAALASYGIDTAADVVLNRIITVPGFGEASAAPLIEWRKRITSRFVFRQQPSQDEIQEVQRIRQSCATKAAQCRTKLIKGAGDLGRALGNLGARAKAADPAIHRSFRDREQARTDLKFLGAPIPHVAPPSPPKPITPAPARQPTRYRTPAPRTPPPATAVSCPTCGGRMVKRMARRGRNAGGYFWGCAAYPRCRGTRNI